VSAVVGERRRVYPGLDQAALRAAVLVGAMTSLVAAQGAGARPALWLQAALTALAILLVVRPESSTGVVLLLGLAYVWWTVPDPLTPLVLLAAAGMVLVHVAALVAAQGPAGMRVDMSQVGLWLWRGAVLWLAGAAVWGMNLLATDLPGGRLVYAAGLTTFMLVAAVATWLVVPRR
jgi:hypothetical protein